MPPSSLIPGSVSTTGLDFFTTDLTAAEFENIRQLLYRLCGIHLNPGKEGLVKSRLMKRLRTLNLGSFAEYLNYMDNDHSGQELTTMIDLLTTNKTSFFREAEHFEFLKSQVLPALLARKQPLRIWSAGCSSGEEPYTLAIVLREAIPDIDRRDVKILATDISTQILAKAKEGKYGRECMEEMEPKLLHKYFTMARSQETRLFQVKDHLRSLIRFARLNLMQPWPMRGPFDVIFCRNVMIYFDKSTQRELVRRYWEILKPGGYLMVGHSESLTNTSKEFRYVQPAVYQK
jgi:chemotaxis protein methyltransferase CheR